MMTIHMSFVKKFADCKPEGKTTTRGKNTTASLKNITREKMLQLLNEDLAREYKAIVELNKQIKRLGGKLGAASDSDATSNVPAELLRAVLENERKMTGCYHERIRQAEAMGEFALVETLRAIIAQEHDPDLRVVLAGAARPSSLNE